MFELDESFLEEVGLSGLSEDQKGVFLQYAQDQLEVRIGEKIGDKLTEEQMTELEKIANNIDGYTHQWLQKNIDYENDESYKALKDSEMGQSENFLADYAMSKWFDHNCPDYRNIVQNTMSDLQEEIASEKDAILAA